MRTVSLTALVTAITAAVIAVAMLAYAVIQYFMMPGMTVWRLAGEHTWHVMVLGALIYATLHVLLHKYVVDPVQQLYMTLYRVARGENELVSVTTRVRELRDIVGCVNMLLVKLSHQLGTRSPREDNQVNGAESIAHGMRAAATKLSDHAAHPTREMLLGVANDLEEWAAALDGSVPSDPPADLEII